jgi:hypothetical protein
MSNLTIHHCSLRIVRQGGWSWGPEPLSLLHGAIKALPELIARELGNIFHDDDDREILTPLRLRIPVKLGELSALAGGDSRNSSLPSLIEVDPLSKRIKNALRAALTDELCTPEITFDDQPTKSFAGDTTQPTSSERSPILDVLTSWRFEGVLTQRLAVFSSAALEAWHSRIMNLALGPNQTDITRLKEIEDIVDEMARGFRNAFESRNAILRRRLIVVAEVLYRLGLHDCPSIVLSILQHTFPIHVAAEETAFNSPDQTGDIQTKDIAQDLLTRESAEDEESVNVGIESATTLNKFSQLERWASAFSFINSSDDGPTTSRNSTARASFLTPQLKPLSEERVRLVASALPFLLLGPLARLGYLKTLAAVLESIDHVSSAPLFATALAYKVLAPPERGWRRHSDVITAASIFSALAQPVAEPDLVKLATDISTHLSPLDAAISGVLIAGHTQSEPLLLMQTLDESGTGFLLLDVDGTFPIQWTRAIEDLRPILIELDSSLILIPRVWAEPQILRWLDEQSLAFITDAKPTRHERWRAVRRPPHERWWTNDTVTSDSLLLTAARRMSVSLEDATTLWQALAIERPSVPLADSRLFDRHLTMAASVALGFIAWELWREAETTAPFLTLERFRTLEARVDYSQEVVTVSLPLGKRFYDLIEHGLLNDVSGVPWFQGRRVVFTSA